MIQCSVFKVRGILKNMKIQTELLHLRHDFFCKLYTLGRLVIYTFTFRYSLASRAFPKAKYSVVCTELLMGSKFYFSQWRIHFSQSIFSEKYLNFNGIEYFIH